MMKNNMILAIAIVFITGFIACGKSGRITTVSSTKIVGGQPLQPGNPGLTSAAAISTNSMTCTGFVAADNLILTAAHCLAEVRRNGTIEINFSERSDSRDPKFIRKSRIFKSHPRFSYPNYDVGWIKFDGGLPDGHTPSKILADASLLTHGYPMTLVGYGLTSERGGTAGRRLTVDTMVNQVLDDSRYVGLLIFGVTPGRSACMGDSGGPAYAKIKDIWYMIGTTSGPDTIINRTNSCAAGAGIYNFTGKHLPWIEESAGVTLH